MSNHLWTLNNWHAPLPPDKFSSDQHFRISLLSKHEDFECCLMAQFGMSMKTIAGYTGLTTGQVYRRLKKAGITVMDFRHGKGPYAQMVFEYLGKRAAQKLTVELRNKDV